MNFEPVKDLLFRLADDDLITGHRMSEWTGMGPILEEDIAFSSIAQDEVGHAQAYYILMHEWMNEDRPDTVAFGRSVEAFRCATLVEHPNVDYAFSLVRHFLYDEAEGLRLEHLSKSSFRPLAELAKKLGREEKYHSLHGQTWVRQLGNGTPESNRRLQEALEMAYPLAFGLFEPTAYNEDLARDGICPTEQELEAEWKERVDGIIVSSGLQVPEVADHRAADGGRKGQHSVHLDALMAEMSEVFVIDPQAAW